MKRIFYALMALLPLYNSQAQGPLRLIAYRNDSYSTGTQTWSMPDSVTFTYPAGMGATGKYNKVYETRTHRDDASLRSRYSQQFNALHQPIETVTELWDTAGFRNYYRESFLYNSAGKMTQTTRQFWDTAGWKNNQKITIGYDSNNDTTGITYSEVDTSANWRVYARYAFLRDAQRRVIKEVDEDFDDNTGTFDTAGIYHYYYDIDGTLAAEMELEPDNNGIIDTYYVKRYTYNNHQLLTGYRVWNDNSGILLPTGGYNYAYNTNNLLADMQNVGIDTSGNEYIYQKLLNNYNGSNLKDTASTQVLYNGAWFTVQKQVFNYNAAGDLEQFLAFNNSPVDGWHSYSQANYQVNEQHLPVYDEVFGFNNEQAYPLTRNFYWYETYEPLTAINEVTTTGLLVYPNPAHNQVNIELPAATYSTAAIYNLQGQQVMQVPVNEQAVKLVISTAGLAPGAYILCAAGNNVQATKKLIIE